MRRKFIFSMGAGQVLLSRRFPGLVLGDFVGFDRSCSGEGMADCLVGLQGCRYWSKRHGKSRKTS